MRAISLQDAINHRGVDPARRARRQDDIVDPSPPSGDPRHDADAAAA